MNNEQKKEMREMHQDYARRLTEEYIGTISNEVCRRLAMRAIAITIMDALASPRRPDDLSETAFARLCVDRLLIRAQDEVELPIG